MVKKKKKPKLWFEEQAEYPFENIRNIEEQFHRTMADMWRKPFRFSFRFPEMKQIVRTIPIQMAQTDKELILRAMLPGFSKDEIKLKVTPNMVDISAEKKKAKIEKTEKYFRAEKSYGSARRVFTLPVEVKTEGVKAKFENGILEIILPKVEVKKKEKEVRVE